MKQNPDSKVKIEDWNLEELRVMIRETSKNQNGIHYRLKHIWLVYQYDNTKSYEFHGRFDHKAINMG